MSDILKLLYYIMFYSELPVQDVFRILNIVAFSFLYKNTEENRKKLSKKLSDLGLVVIKLSQWLSYFIEIKYENYDNLQLFIQSLPLLQCNCKKTKKFEIKSIFR